MMRRGLPLALILCLTMPIVGAAGTCCASPDVSIARMAPACCCPDAASCAMRDEACVPALADEPAAVLSETRRNHHDASTAVSASPPVLLQLAHVPLDSPASDAPPGAVHPSRSLPLRL